MVTLVRTIDATAYAFLLALTKGPFESESKTHTLSLPNVTGYVDRMRQQLFAQ